MVKLFFGLFNSLIQINDFWFKSRESVVIVKSAVEDKGEELKQKWKPLELRCFFLLSSLVYVPQHLTPDLSSKLRHSPWWFHSFSLYLEHHCCTWNPLAPHRPSIPCTSGSQDEILEGNTVMSCNTHVTLLTNLASSKTCHIPCHTPALVPPRTHQPWSTAITASHRLPRFPEFILHSNSGITNTDLNINISSLVPVPVPVPILVLFLSHIPT